MEVIIETFCAEREASSSSIRARPLPGQGLSTKLRVGCSKSMRRRHPVGTLFKVRAQLTNREGGTPFLYANYRDPYTVLTPDEATRFIGASNARRARTK